jgi:enolase
MADNIVRLDVTDQAALDSARIALYGTESKSKLAANKILSVSMAAANGTPKGLEMPLFKYHGDSNAKILLVPIMNILNGGAYSDTPIDIQEFMIMPHHGATMREAIKMGTEIFLALKRILKNMGLSSAIGDQGGFAPEVSSNEPALEIIDQALESAASRPGHDISIALTSLSN